MYKSELLELVTMNNDKFEHKHLIVTFFLLFKLCRDHYILFHIAQKFYSDKYLLGCLHGNWDVGRFKPQSIEWGLHVKAHNIRVCARVSCHKHSLTHLILLKSPQPPLLSSFPLLSWTDGQKFWSF